MEYLKKNEYDKWDEDEIGYTQPASGDSGSPYMFKNKRRRGVARYTFVAIAASYYQRGKQAAGTYMKGRRTQCRDVTTKLTKEILLWIKQKAGIIHT